MKSSKNVIALSITALVLMACDTEQETELRCKDTKGIDTFVITNFLSPRKIIYSDEYTTSYEHKETDYRFLVWDTHKRSEEPPDSSASDLTLSHYQIDRWAYNPDTSVKEETRKTMLLEKDSLKFFDSLGGSCKIFIKK